MRRGQSTWFLRNQVPGAQWGTVQQLRAEPEPTYGTNDTNPPIMPVRVNPAVVHLPEDPRTPLVMVGLGTGLAPFRSFIQQRVMQKAAGQEVGEMLLYFGARYEATEFLYGDEIEGTCAPRWRLHRGYLVVATHPSVSASLSLLLLFPPSLTPSPSHTRPSPSTPPPPCSQRITRMAS